MSKVMTADYRQRCVDTVIAAMEKEKRRMREDKESEIAALYKHIDERYARILAGIPKVGEKYDKGGDA